MVEHIYLVRHGETDFNLHNIVQGGGIDSVLNEKGKRQAEALAQRLQGSGFQADIMFSSPLKRAKETADILAKSLKQEVHTDSLLKEISCGNFEGQKWTELDPIIVNRVRRDPKETYPGGEGILHVHQRAEKFIQKMENLPVKSILIVSHGHFLRCFATALLSLEPLFTLQLFQDNCAYSYFKKTEEFYKLIVWNDVSHSRDLLFDF
ncbi:MAG: histidine phosphatase family protein [Leptospiraceae bacterium]|nr:histidine phosphatase family protein [Leptospiraceae bacterium]MCP5499341.1 histidine phosphatase family protein [Leptospiraceae bacterium]